jgi:hypothetical protein
MGMELHFIARDAVHGTVVGHRNHQSLHERNADAMATHLYIVRATDPPSIRSSMTIYDDQFLDKLGGPA